MKKRITSIILILALAVMMLPTNAAAASCAATVKNFGSGTVLSYTQYDLLRTGTISAVKKSGEWYYQFKKGGNVLLVKASAFAENVGNNLNSVDNALTKGMMRTDGIAQTCSFAIKARTKTESKLYTELGTPVKRTQIKSYTTYISWLNFEGNRVGTITGLKCRKNGHVEFVYTDKVSMKYALKNGYQAPSNAREYMMALKRNITNGVSTKMVPTFELDITKPGKNCVCLNSCKYQGNGITDTKTPVADYIEVAFTAAAIVKDLATGSLPFKNLYKLYSQGTKMQKVSAEYVNNDDVLLSKNKKKVMKGKFSSPVSLKKSGDYFKAAILLNTAPSTSGTKTQMKVKVSIKFK